MLPHVYRITKYDPADRDERGVYTGTEDSVSDHGPVEAAYLRAVAAFAEETGVRTLAIRDPEVASGFVHFGVTFVDIGGFTAMVDVPQLSWRPVDHPGDVVAVGDRITAEVLDVDLVRERVPLSLRALQEDPITQFTRWVGRVVTGEVTRLVPAGALVRIEDRPDGFVGLLPAAGRAPSPSVRIGDRFPVSVVAVDPARRRITLSRAEPDGAEADGGT